MMAAFFGVRHVQCLLMSLSYAIFYLHWDVPGYCLLTITWGADTKQTLLQYLDLQGIHNNFYIICAQNMLMMSLATIAGIYSVHKSSKYLLLGLGVLQTIILYSISPFIQTYGWNVLSVLKVIFNIIKGAVDPLLYSCIHKWIPNIEKGRLAALIFSGKMLAVVLGNPIGFYLSEPRDKWSEILFWASNFGVIWAIAWAAFYFDHPKACFYIDENEKKYIRDHQPHTAKYGQIANTLWYGHLAALIIAYPIGYIADMLAAKQVSVSKIRKVSTCIGMWFGGACLGFMGHAPSTFWANCMAALFVILMIPTYVGFYISFLDMSPNFSSILFALTSSASYMPTMWEPVVRAALVREYKNGPAGL